jgi:predicted ATPase
LLRRLQRRIAEPEHKFANLDHLKMYFCELGQEGSTIRPVEVNQYGQIANWPDNFFGDISGDLEAMTKAGLQQRRQELADDRLRG